MQNSILQWLSSKLLERKLQPRELLTARKVVYIVLIIGLFTASFFWRRAAVDARAVELALRQDSRGDVELSGELIRLSLTGSRGLATCYLWVQAIDKQKKNQWNEMELLVRSLTKLQPHFITPWLFQSWNLSYNVAVESDRIHDKYFYITRGIDLLAEGERQNRYHPDMRFSLGFYLQQKIMLSDQTNVMRSLLQLSMIPPSERDPDRFLKRAADGGEEIDWGVFEEFIKKRPQLARRLHSGQMRDTRREYRNQFTCGDVEDVIHFLRDNWRVPGLYETPEKRPGVVVEAKDVLLPPEARFPPLPPDRPNAYRPCPEFTELTSSSELDDRVDGYSVSRAWYSYAQEPLPPADYLPGSNSEIKDRVHQRRPRHMTTLLFRNYPALAHSAGAERLEQEGWFCPDVAEEERARKTGGSAEEYWVFPEDSWFKTRGNLFSDKKTRARLVLPKDQHLDKVWDEAHRIWEQTGRSNHLLFEDARRESETYQDALAYCSKHGVAVGTQLPPPAAGIESLSSVELRQYRAAQFLFEYKFYRDLSNFPSHYNRSKVESEKVTVIARKRFFEAEMAAMRGDLVKAREIYERPDAMAAWRDQVLLGCVRENGQLVPRSDTEAKTHRMYRDSWFIQEQTFEVQLRYLQFYNEQYGTKIKRELTGTWAKASLPAMPLPAGCGAAYALHCLVPVVIESDYSPPPIRGAYADLIGPFDVFIFDLNVDERDRPDLARWVVRTQANLFAGAPLPAAMAAATWAKPIVAEGTRYTVRDRMGLTRKQ